MRSILPDEQLTKILNTITGIIGQNIMALGMICDHLFWPALTIGKSKIHF